MFLSGRLVGSNGQKIMSRLLGFSVDATYPEVWFYFCQMFCISGVFFLLLMHGPTQLIALELSRWHLDGLVIYLFKLLDLLKL